MKKNSYIGFLIFGIIGFLIALFFLSISIFYNGPTKKLKEQSFVTINGIIESAEDRGHNQMFLIKLQGNTSIYSVNYHDLNNKIVTPAVLKEKCIQGVEIEIICYEYHPYIYYNEDDSFKDKLWFSIEDLTVDGVQYKILEESIANSELAIEESKESFRTFAVFLGVFGLIVIVIFFFLKIKK